MPIAIPDFGFFKKGEALAKELKKTPARESKKASALRVELDKTNLMLWWMCRCIDKYNDDAERPLCPSQKTKCGVGASCSNCWLMAALSEVNRG